jgi:hypothetical protein
MTSESDRNDSEKDMRGGLSSKMDSMKADSIIKDKIILKENQIGSNISLSVNRRENLQRSILKR